MSSDLKKLFDQHDKRLNNLEDNFKELNKSRDDITTLKAETKELQKDVNSIQEQVIKITEVITTESKKRQEDFSKITTLISDESEQRKEEYSETKVLIEKENHARKKHYLLFKIWILSALCGILATMIITAAVGSWKMQNFLKDEISTRTTETKKKAEDNEKRIIDIYKSRK